MNTKASTKVSKKFLVALALLGSASFAHADYKLVSADDSDLSKLCIAAAESSSREGILAAAEAAGVGLLDLPDVRCNGLTLERFGAKYRSSKGKELALLDTSSPASPLNVILRKTDSTPETELCAAAAVSEAAYASVKATYFSKDDNIESEIHCNDMPLKSFVRKYRSGSTALVSAR
ncbi:MAG: hypothetical protein SV422_08400 [Pseudomonadota bacterium]|nr:hypothetical protein [Pseudomonadota bacterium]